MDQNIIRGKLSPTLSTAAYSGKLTVSDASYVDGGIYYIKPASNSVEGATLNINSIGAKNLYKSGGIRINIDDLIANKWYELIYNSTLNGFQVTGLPQTIVAEYDFATLGGSENTYSLTSSIPVGIILKSKSSVIKFTTIPTTAGEPRLAWGTTSVIDIIDRIRPLTDFDLSSNIAPYYPTANDYGSFEITAGGAGSINTVTVSGVNILNGVVAYSTSRPVTAANVCKNINANPNGNIRAINLEQVVYLYSANQNKFAHALMATAQTVGATATTMTIGNVNNFGVLGTGFSGDAESFLITTPESIVFTISDDTITAGKIRAYIPYEIS